MTTYKAGHKEGSTWITPIGRRWMSHGEALAGNRIHERRKIRPFSGGFPELEGKSDPSGGRVPGEGQEHNRKRGLTWETLCSPMCMLVAMFPFVRALSPFH